MDVKVEIDARQIRKALDEVRGWHGERRKKLAQAVQTSATNVEREAKKLAPVDTGRLRASIRRIEEDRGLAASVETDVEYAPYVEFGTSKMAAQPYLFPAAESERPHHLLRMRSALKD